MDSVTAPWSQSVSLTFCHQDNKNVIEHAQVEDKYVSFGSDTAINKDYRSIEVASRESRLGRSLHIAIFYSMVFTYFLM